MVVIGITGSMAMGKSTLVALLRGISKAPIWDADQVVRDLLTHNAAIIQRVCMLFPDVLENGAINRATLKKNVFANPLNLLQLEKILHPAVQQDRARFIQKQRRMGTSYCFLDIPLLFETGAQKECDYVFVVTAPAFLQKQRIRQRFGHGNQQAISAVLARQMPNHEKCKRADCIIQTGIGRRAVLQQIMTFLEGI